MKLATVRWKWLGTCVLLWACGAASLHAQNSMFGAGGEQPPTAPPSNKVPAILSGVDFTPPFGAKLPGDAQFRDDLGQSVKLGDYFGSKPVILAFGYYQCPMLCTEVQRGIASVLKVVKFRPGKDFSVVFISFNPKASMPGKCTNYCTFWAKMSCFSSEAAHRSPGWDRPGGDRESRGHGSDDPSPQRRTRHPQRGAGDPGEGCALVARTAQGTRDMEGR